LRHESILEKTYYGKGHQIAIEPKGFRLEILSGESDSYRAGYRVYPYRYRIGAPSGVERIVPIAFDAHDFVEEWGSLAWEEAAKWSASAQSEKLRSWHDRYRDADGYFGGEFPRTQSCGGALWQVEYSPPGEDSDSIFYVVQRLNKWSFVMKDVRQGPLSGCTDVPQPASFSTMFDKPLEW
jgi:hypothetical protein